MSVKEICKCFKQAGFNVSEKRYRSWEEEGCEHKKYNGKPATIEEIRFFSHICGASAAYILQGLEPPLIKNVGGTSQEDIRKFLYNELTVNVINDLGRMSHDQQIAFNAFWSAFIKPMVANPSSREESLESYQRHMQALHKSLERLKTKNP